MFHATFLALNRKKLKFAYAATAITFLALVLVILGIALFNDAVPSIGLIVAILVVAGIVFPIFTIFLGWLGWHYKKRKRTKAFLTPPFDELDRIGFRRSLVNENSKWVFTDEAWQGKFNGFTILCNVVNERYHIIEMEVFCQRRQLEKAEFAALSEKFKQYDIEFGFGSLVKQYDTKRLTIYTAAELKNDLEQFTRLLKQEGFEPADITESKQV